MPGLMLGLRWLGAAWMLWLAWGIATAPAAAPAMPAGARPEGGREGGREGGPGMGPMTLLQAALFQWVNPKAWMIALAAIPAFTTPAGDTLAETLRIAIVFAVEPSDGAAAV